MITPRMKMAATLTVMLCVFCGTAGAALTELTTTNGCLAYVANFQWEVEHVEWSLPCSPGKPIEGNGVLRILTKSNGYWFELSGPFANGAGNGEITFKHTREPAGDKVWLFGGCFGGMKDCQSRPAPPVFPNQTDQKEAPRSRQGNSAQSRDSARTKVIASGENASQCVAAVTDQPGLGYFKNNCGFNVEILFCVMDPKKDSWAAGHRCTGGSGGGVGGGMVSAAANERSSVVHIKDAGRVLWFACKKPAIPANVRLDSGRELLVGLCQ